MTADLRQAPDLPGDLPLDPLARAWEDILAAVLAEGPPEDPFDLPGDPVAESWRVLRVAEGRCRSGIWMARRSPSRWRPWT